jgi:hypothetical protein
VHLDKVTIVRVGKFDLQGTESPLKFVTWRLRILLRMRILKPLLFLVWLTSLALAADPLRCPAHVTHMSMERGAYSPQPGAVFDLSSFDADMMARGNSSPLCFVRTTQIRSAQVFVSSESLSRMFELKIAQSNSKVSDIKVETRDNNTARLSGKIKKKVTLPFEIEGPVSTDGRDLVLDAKEVNAGKLPIKWLLGMLGENLAKLLGSNSVSGVLVKGNTLIFQPSKIAHVEGHISKLQLTNQGMRITFAEVEQNTRAGRGYKP